MKKQLPPDVERELMDLVFRHRDPLMSLDNLLRPYVDLMLRYGAAQAATERERTAQVAHDRAVEWDAIKAAHDGDGATFATADARWREACDIAALILAP